MKFDRFRHLLGKYLNNDASKTERMVVDQWYDALDDGSRPTPLWKSDSDKRAAKDKIEARLTQRIQGRKRRTSPFIRIAAMLIATLSVSLLIFRISRDTGHLTTDSNVPSPEEPTIVATGTGEVKHVILPDSSEVWLNANSSLDIPTAFNQENRVVTLQGEGFFEVRKSAGRPFTVRSPDVAVVVWGTSFNVKAYQELEEAKVTVETGKVEVRNAADVKLAMLTADDQLTYRKTPESFQVGSVEGGLYSAWKQGRVILEKASFNELARGFFNLYGVKLMTDDHQLQDEQIDMVLQNSLNQEASLDIICTILNKQYRKEARGIILY